MFFQRFSRDTGSRHERIQNSVRFLQCPFQIVELIRISQWKANGGWSMDFRMAKLLHQIPVLLSNSKLCIYEKQLYVCEEPSSEEAKVETSRLKKGNELIGCGFHVLRWGFKNWYCTKKVDRYRIKMLLKPPNDWLRNWIQPFAVQPVELATNLVELQRRMDLSTGTTTLKCLEILCLSETRLSRDFSESTFVLKIFFQEVIVWHL